MWFVTYKCGISLVWCFRGQLKIGEVVEVVEQQTNEKGVLRLRIAARGWASERAGDGTVILVAEEEPEP